MTAYDAYSLYTSIRLHFTQKSYDCFKYNFKTSTSEEAFQLRKDRYSFLRLSRMYNPEELRFYLASNFFTNPKSYIRELLIPEAKDVYLERKKIVESLAYSFQNDLQTLFRENKDHDAILRCKTGNYPILLEYCLESRIQVESLIILNHFLRFFPVWSKKIDDTIIFPEYLHRVRKYTPFVHFDGDVMKKIIQKQLTNTK